MTVAELSAPVGSPAGVHCFKEIVIVDSTIDDPGSRCFPLMNSDEIARYVEQTDRLSKPWVLIQWRLQKLQERQADMEAEAYCREVAELHHALMALGEWWIGREDEVF